MNKSFFFNADTSSGSADITYSAADLAAEKAAYFSDGVLAPDDFKVSAVDSLTVKIAPGGAVLGGYTYVNSSIGVRAIPSAAATKARRDLCVLKLDLSIRAMTVVIKSGTPSDDPQPPALTSTDSVKELALAEIYMPAGASSVNEATVTDLRKLASLRGAPSLIEAEIKAHEAETDALTKSENAEVRKVCGAVKTDGTSGEVLCGDGKYRTVLPYRRTLLQIYNRAGEYEFDTSKNPSDANRYDFEIIGGGGAGGCCGHSDSRGGGGGAGAYVSVCGVTLSHGTHKIKIGAGGSGIAERSGGDGGESSFAGYHAPGGSGGVGGTWVEGMSFPGGEGGAVGAYTGERGGDGGYSLPSDEITSCGNGAPSPFGAGGEGVSGSSSSGKKGIGAGSGGSGGGCVSTSFSASGGNGADGCLLIYGYHTTAFGTAAAE